MPEDFHVLARFLYDRWLTYTLTPQKLRLRQQRGLANYLRRILPRAAFYAPQQTSSIEDLPLTDKTQMREHFEGMNTLGISLAQAEAVALAAENSRDFSSTINGTTVGLSSGTSGQRSVFLVTRQEQLRWAGIMLSKFLAPQHLRQMLFFWKCPLEIAFFLRSNSNLYQSVAGRRLHLDYYDLQQPVITLVRALAAQRPDILVAPASVLAQLARTKLEGGLNIAPSRIISVAEVLEADDCALIERAFGIKPLQIYQATEGFLAYTCSRGSLHLNERYLYIEPEWLDEQRERFIPIVTDFSRSTQIIARYRLNDVLRDAHKPCACGCPERVIAEVEGRSDDVLYLPSRTGKTVPVFADSLRRTLLLAGSDIEDYRLTQTALGLEFQLKTIDKERAQAVLEEQMNALWKALDIVPPALSFKPWQSGNLVNKRRRIIRLIALPETA